jgi:Tol biopolymer transport system component
MNLSRRSLGRFASWAVVGAVPWAAAACAGVPSVDTGRGNLLSDDFDLSPDGRTIAFGAGKQGIGLYDWRTGHIDFVPLPAGVQYLMWVHFSPDGSKLTAVAMLPQESIDNPRELRRYRLAILDLPSRQAALFEVPQRVFSSPMLRQDGRAILYAAEDRLFLFDLTTGRSQALLPEQDKFSDIRTPSFVASDTVLFVARNPRNAELQATIKQWGGNLVAGTIPYLLKMGSRPVIAYPEFVRRELSDRYGSLPTVMPASRNGERIVFIGPSQGERARKRHETGGSPYDLFVIEGSQVRQVTHLENYLAFDAISYDGSTAAFGVYPGAHSEVSSLRRGAVPLELAIVNLDTGQITRTDFTARVASEMRSKASKD